MTMTFGVYLKQLRKWCYLTFALESSVSENEFFFLLSCA